MVALSAAVEFAWQMAADEASYARAVSIEPHHFMIGVCSFDKLTIAKRDDALRQGDQWYAEALTEFEEWADSLGKTKLNAELVRRTIRTSLSVADKRPQGDEVPKMKRSQASLAVFRRAEELSGETGVVRLLDLAFALLEAEDRYVKIAFTRLGTDTSLLFATLHRGRMGIRAVEDSDVHVAERCDVSADVYQLSSRTQTEHAHTALLYELPLQFGRATSKGDLLQHALAGLAAVIPGVSSATLLIKNPLNGALQLEAHLPKGAPAVSLTMVHRTIETNEAYLWTRERDGSTASLDRYSAHSGIHAPLIWQGRTLGVLSISSTKANQILNSEDLRLVVAVAHHAAMAIAHRQVQDELQRKTGLLERLLPNFPPRTRELLVKRASMGRLQLGGQMSEVTMLCSDIRGFTQLSAGLPTDSVMDLLNDYFSILVDAIFRCDGTIDKFAGDGILAVFGSPEPDEAHYEKALRSAVAMQQGMLERNEFRRGRHLMTCEIGVGLHCGEVIHGFVGNTDHMQFTVVGDAANKTSRYCDGARGGEILLSPQLYQHVWNLVDVEPSRIPTKHEGDFEAYRLKSLRT